MPQTEWVEPNEWGTRSIETLLEGDDGFLYEITPQNSPGVEPDGVLIYTKTGRYTMHPDDAVDC